MQRSNHWLLTAGIAMAFAVAPTAWANSVTHGQTGSKPQLNASKINHSQLIRLKNSVPIQALTQKDAGAMATTDMIPGMTLLLKRTPQMQNKFKGYINSLNNASSNNYHKWLTPQQIGTMFGPNKKDVATVVTWLKSQGFQVLSVSPTRMSIRFAGSVGTVEQAFHTQIHSFRSNGKMHFANVTDQQIPAALQPVVSGVQSLDNFFPTPQTHQVGTVKRNSKGQWVGVKPNSSSDRSSEFNFGYQGRVLYDVVPADFTTIYNANPLYSASENGPAIRGQGQTIAVLEETNVQPEDVATFRNSFLPADALGAFTQVHPAGGNASATCTDPGMNSAEGEAALDAEWAGAAAPDADIMLASCQSSGANFGAFVAAQNLLDGATAQNPAPQIMSLSYGECEQVAFGTGDGAAAANLWDQAAAQGVTVFVSTGDSGSATCDQNQAAAYHGLSVNSFASSPSAVGVGGTDFDDFQNYEPYWARANFARGESALGYIPEQTWNNSCASSTLDSLLGFGSPVDACNSATGQNFLGTGAGGGGPSTNYYQPSWQTGIYGTPQTQNRVLPDVALFSASGLYGHALIYCMSDANNGGTPCNYLDPQNAVYNSAGGTSFAAPAMAGIQALINQKIGSRSGNMNPIFSNLGRKQYGSNGSPNSRLVSLCSSSAGSSDNPDCVYNDVGKGNIAVPCYGGTDSCYTEGVDDYGVLSSGGTETLVPAWKATEGYDYTTGLGTINVTNMVNAVARYHATASYAAAPWSFNGSIDQDALNDGYSDAMLVNANGDAVSLAMNGGTALSEHTGFNIGAGYKLSAVVNLMGGFFSTTPTQPYLVADNPSAHTFKLMTQTLPLDNYSFAVDDSGEYSSASVVYPAGFHVVGSGDMNGDGNPELFVRNDSDGMVGWVSVQCEPGFFSLSCSAGTFTTIAAASGYTPRLADLNGDGFTDIVWTSDNNDIYYWINNQNGDFSRTNGGFYPAGWSLVGTGSINGDHDSDLIWFNASTNQYGWWLMDGKTVGDMVVRSSTPGYSIASVEDFDGDGLADLLWTNAAGDAYVWEGTGGHFVSQRVADGTGAAISIPAGYTVQSNHFQGMGMAQQMPR